MKPGIKTTEFWLTLAAQIIAMLVIVGVVSSTDQQTVETAVGDAIKAVGALAASVITLWRYVQGRIELKNKDQS